MSHSYANPTVMSQVSASASSTESEPRSPARGISVVIPCFNSEASLPLLLPRLDAVLGQLDLPYEVLLVEDGSRDRTWAAIEVLAGQFPAVRGWRLMRNYGQHSALLCGIREARFDVTITLDDDLQNPPEEIPRLLAPFQEGFDVVYGRPEHEQHGVLRDLASLVTKAALQEVMGAETARHVSGFRILRTELRRAFERYYASYVSIDVMLTWGTTRFTAVPVRNDPRRLGASNYTLWKLLVHAMNMMTGYTTLPLQVASMIGLLMASFGVLLLFYIIGRYIVEGGSVPGFPFLACVISIFSGAQLFALGIIGEYLGRIHFRTMERPPYVVRESTRAAG